MLHSENALGKFHCEMLQPRTAETQGHPGTLWEGSMERERPGEWLWDRMAWPILTTFGQGVTRPGLQNVLDARGPIFSGWTSITGVLPGNGDSGSRNPL